MSRGGRWKADIENAPTPRRGRWRKIETTLPPKQHKPLNSENHEVTESSMFDWALDQWVTGKQDQGPEEGVINFSGLDHDEKLIKTFQDAVYQDGGMQYLDRIENEAAREAIAWSAGAGWPHVLSVFKRLLDLMANVMDRATSGDDPVMRKAAKWYASALSNMARSFAKFSNGEWQPERVPEHISEWTSKKALAGEPMTTIDRIWLNDIFQDALKSQQKTHRRTSSPQKCFAEYVADLVVGHAAANARINDRKLVLYGIEWMPPKTEEDFKTMRDLLMRVSGEHFQVLADLLAKDGQARAAEKVRALKRPADRFRYWHESQLDESFRAHFGLSKSRKKKGLKKRPKRLKVNKLQSG